MKLHILLLAAIALLICSPVLFAQDHDDDGPGDMEDLERQEIASRLQHDQRMRDLEYKRAEMELEAERLEMEWNLKEAERKLDHKYKGKNHGGAAALFLLICFVVHILLAVWVYTDIRARNAGSGIWIVATLLTGFFGCLLYAVVRMGDGNGGKTKKG